MNHDSYMPHGYCSLWQPGLSTAPVSLATAIVLFPTIPKALALRGPAELERLNDELEKALLQKDVLASSYRTGAEESEIGGDWFDAFALSEHEVDPSDDVMSESGHGLPLVATYGRDLVIERTERGNRISVTLPVHLAWRALELR
jgi:hypothetical protein